MEQLPISINIDPEYSDFKIVPNKELSYFLAKKDKVSYVYNVINLEGNPITFPEVQTLLEGITVGGHKLEDEQQVLNQNKSLELLLSLVRENKFGLNKDVFMELNRTVAAGEALVPGAFRTGRVTIGGTDFIPPPAENLQSVFEEGLEEIKSIKNPVTRALVFFGFGSLNQFFWDGNKRTARLMANGVLMENGYPVLNISARDKLDFNKAMIRFYDSQDYNVLLSWLAPYYKEAAVKMGFIEITQEEAFSKDSEKPMENKNDPDDPFTQDLKNRLNKNKLKR